MKKLIGIFILVFVCLFIWEKISFAWASFVWFRFIVLLIPIILLWCLNTKIQKEAKLRKEQRVAAELQQEREQEIKKQFHDKVVQCALVLTQLCSDMELLSKVGKFMFQEGTLSVPALQREFKMSYDKAVFFLQILESAGVVSELLDNGFTQREILVTGHFWVVSVEFAESLYKKELKEQDALTEWNKRHRLPYRDDFCVDIHDISICDNMSGFEFEEWCAVFLQDLGFTNVSKTPVSGDQGVDLIAEKGGIKYAIQCKCYSHDLGNTSVQEVYAGKAIYNCHVGVVMTNRHFTSGARQAAEATGVLLWDRDWILSHQNHD